MIDATVVGAGIFGSVIAAVLRRDGHEVLVVDAAFEGGGSRPSGNLMKPSWFSSLGKDTYSPALATLDEVCGVEDIAFRVGPAQATVHFCPPSRLLVDPDLSLRVEAVYPSDSGWVVDVGAGGTFESRRVILATGVWTPELVDIAVDGRAGVSFLWPGRTIDRPFIRLWAPYKHLAAFNRGDGLWIGDGSAIKTENWQPSRTEACLGRCRKALKEAAPDPPPQQLFGVRPYIRGAKPCYLSEYRPGLWVATGGAKNGLIAAGWAGYQVGRRLQ